MGELKYKQAPPLTKLAEGLECLIDKGQGFYSDIKNVLEDQRLKRVSLPLSAIKILISSYPVLATFRFQQKCQRMMFLIRKKGHTIDYSNPFHEPCPTMGVKHTELKRLPV